MPSKLATFRGTIRHLLIRKHAWSTELTRHWMYENNDYIVDMFHQGWKPYKIAAIIHQVVKEENVE